MGSDLIYEVIDMMLWPHEIDMVLNEAILLCPAAKRFGVKMYPANAKRAVPDVCYDDHRAYLVAELLNALIEWL